jgi:hypothetical protein
MSVIDSLVVRGEFDPTGVSTGLAEMEREIQQFAQRTASLGAPKPIDLRITGADAATSDIRLTTQAVEDLAAANGRAAASADELARAQAAAAALVPPPPILPDTIVHWTRLLTAGTMGRYVHRSVASDSSSRTMLHRDRSLGRHA